MNLPAETIAAPELHRGLLERDEAIVEWVVDRYLNGLYQYTRGLLRSDQEAEDVVQETFLKLWQAPQQWNPNKGALSTWLYRVAHNRCLDILRRSKRTEAVHETVEISHASAVEEEKDQGGIFELAFQRLSTEYRNALILAYGQGMAAREMAEVLGISSSAVNSLMARARRQLHELIGRQN